jgi:hypothetical protein
MQSVLVTENLILISQAFRHPAPNLLVSAQFQCAKNPGLDVPVPETICSIVLGVASTLIENYSSEATYRWKKCWLIGVMASQLH